MNGPERTVGEKNVEIKKRKEIKTPQELALRLGFVRIPGEKGDFVQRFEKMTDSGAIHTFLIQGSKYKDERGVRISLGAQSPNEPHGGYKEEMLCQSKLFNEDMKALGLITRTSATMFYRPEMTPEVMDRLFEYIKKLEDAGLHDFLTKK